MSGRNVLIETGHSFSSDIELFFYPKSDEVVETLPETTTWPDLLVPQVFASRSQCRKAGYNEIPYGWTDTQIGKLHTRYCVLKPAPFGAWSDDDEDALLHDLAEDKLPAGYLEQLLEHRPSLV